MIKLKFLCLWYAMQDITMLETGKDYKMLIKRKN